ncbi:MAG: PIG-L deacetylase family protein, partial [Candidatus Hodarchaeales archaeon]
MKNNFDLIAISPHPDDAEIGCGGTLALLSELGYRIAIV